MKNLTWADDIRRTPAIVRSVELLDPYFDGEPSIIKSGLRTPTDQLKLILEKAVRHGVDKEFQELLNYADLNTDRKMDIDGQELFWWQRGWSRLLSLGDIVNPPVSAKVLFDYFRPGSQGNKKGEVIGISPHMRGLAFDIGGGKSLTEKAKRVMRASQIGDCFIKSFLCEHVNNAVHVDVFQIG